MFVEGDSARDPKVEITPAKAPTILERLLGKRSAGAEMELQGGSTEGLTEVAYDARAWRLAERINRFLSRFGR